MKESGAAMFYCAHQAYICVPCDVIIRKHKEGCVCMCTRNAVTVEKPKPQTDCADNLNLRAEALLLDLKYLQEFLTSILRIFFIDLYP
jgi:hypothetical protein